MLAGGTVPAAAAANTPPPPPFTRRERVATLIDDLRGSSISWRGPIPSWSMARRSGRCAGGSACRGTTAGNRRRSSTTRPAPRHAPGSVAAVAVAADTSRRDPATLHPRWAAQVHSFALPDGSGTSGWLTAFAVDERGVLLPVLAARDDVVDDAVTEMFGELRPDLVRGGADAAGWAHGRLAADLAKLDVADLDAADDRVEAEQPALPFLTAEPGGLLD